MISIIFTSLKKIRQDEKWWALLIIASFAGITYLPFFSPVITADDWSVIVWGGVFHIFPPVGWLDRRPLLYLLNNIYWSFFGINIYGFYVLNLFLLVLIAYLIFLLVKIASPNTKWLALPVSLLSMLYPVDYTRMWMTMVNIRFAWALALGAVLILSNYCKRGEIWKYYLALFMIILSLGVYEGQLGFLFISVIALFVIERPMSKDRIWFLLFLPALLVLFGFWRVWGQRILFGINDPYVDSISFDLVTIFSRYFHGAWIFLSGWVKPYAFYFYRTEQTMLVYLLEFFFAICALGLLLLARFEIRDKGTLWLTQSRSLLILAAVGFVLWLAGYVPVIIAVPPNLDTVSSRVNIFAIPGASLFFCSSLGALFLNLLKSVRKTIILLWVLLLPFLGLGVFTQNWLQYASRSMWQEQKIIWNGIINFAPDFKDDTLVVIVLPTMSSQKVFQYAPFIDDWETTSGLTVLYNNTRLIGKLYFLDGSSGYSVQLDEYGVLPPRANTRISYDHTVFFMYDPDKGQVKLINDLASELNLPFANPTLYSPNNRILPLCNEIDEEYRYLVR